MGLGGTAKKLQKVMDSAEKLYAKMNEIIGELKQLQEDVEDTSSQVDNLEREMAKQRALLEAMADQQGIDADAVIADADLPPVPDDGDADDDEGESQTGDSEESDTVEDEQSATGDGENAESGTDVPVSEEANQ